MVKHKVNFLGEQACYISHIRREFYVQSHQRSDAALMNGGRDSRRMASSEGLDVRTHNPLLGLDIPRLEAEMERYHLWLDERTEEAYAVAEQARKKRLDPRDHVEIPRAADLAGRTEKLLIEHLEAHPVADDIRAMLAEHDRETTSILMAQKVARAFREKGYDLVKSIDVGLRVGLAVLTEAVLVAPLEGISEVKLLSNVDGSSFISVYFAGPIRAAGGTAQALAVLIADMIRRELGIDPYRPTDPEVERVKEEFGLYRGNLQYRPSPAEIEEIVRACPIMINGESTERIECAGYGRVRNVDDTRIRGGVLLVIGEGMCLKAPKIQKHTERLKVPGWDFISKFAAKGKSKEGSGPEGFSSRKVAPISKFMADIIAGRPVFGGPLTAGGFRLRYGRGRPSGLAAASANPACMAAMDDFITVGTQMKIERPGKACAVTPSNESDGPSVVLRDGRFLKVHDLDRYLELKDEVASVWDNGELVLGYGEFMENNRTLVPAGYTMDWWASDLLDRVVTEADANDLAGLLRVGRDALPDGLPGVAPGEDDDGRALARIDWHQHLRRQTLDWAQASSVAKRFGCALPPPHNPWLLDLPIEWVPALLDVLDGGRIEDGAEGRRLRLPEAVRGWTPETMDELRPERAPDLEMRRIPGGGLLPQAPIFGGEPAEWWTLIQHGLTKGAMLLLGVEHHHEGDDLVLTTGWEGMLEALGFSSEGDRPMVVADMATKVKQRLDDLRAAAAELAVEGARKKALEAKRATVRIAAETDARQRGLGIAETDEVGRKAAEEVPDPGPDDPKAHLRALRLDDDHAVDGLLPLVRSVSSHRWEHAAPVRVGCRMGRPEKAAPRMMSPTSHALFPIDLAGGPQRLLAAAEEKRTIRVQVGRRTCTVCGKPSPYLSCHHRRVDDHGIERVGETCGGPTTMDGGDRSDGRRRGELQTLHLDTLLEDARIRLGLDRLPRQVKCVKVLPSRNQTPEPIEKGILRAHHDLPVFRDGTVRFDMSDVPVTHFRPAEIGTSVSALLDLGYTHDHRGAPLERDDQLLEMLPQDFIVAASAKDYLLRTTAFIDELLQRFYSMPAFYEASTPEDLVGHLICVLAPHTSGGVLSRIIGWADCSGGYAHPLLHAAKRRNCDGDEDAIMLLMDGLLNFSRDILPANRGGQMDAPLVLTTRLNPTEVDKEALNVDCAWYYEAAFYEATKQQPHPKQLLDMMDIAERRLGTVAAVRGYGFTHDCDAMDRGPALSAYKTLESMIDKMNGQLDLGHRLRGVDIRLVASSVIRSHFLPDLRGNLNAYARQKVRCVKCGHSYRRMPLAGKCIQPTKVTGRGLSAHGVGRSEGDQCGGNLALTVSEGAVRKYIDVTRHVMETYGVDTYTQQNVEWLASSVDSLFNNDRARQLSLADFL